MIVANYEIKINNLNLNEPSSSQTTHIIIIDVVVVVLSINRHSEEAGELL